MNQNKINLEQGWALYPYSVWQLLLISQLDKCWMQYRSPRKHAYIEASCSSVDLIETAHWGYHSLDWELIHVLSHYDRTAWTHYPSRRKNAESGSRYLPLAQWYELTLMMRLRYEQYPYERPRLRYEQCIFFALVIYHWLTCLFLCQELFLFHDKLNSGAKIDIPTGLCLT